MMLGPISSLNAYSMPGVQPVVELSREGIQPAPSVQTVQPTQPVQPIPASQGVSTRQQTTSSQQGTNAQPAQATGTEKTAQQPQAAKNNGEKPQTGNTRTPETNGQSKSGLSPQELALIAQLAQSDTRVRDHEQAHISAGGNLIRGGPSFEFETGPDQKRYAVGGEVSIDTTPDKDPAATASKAEHIRRAALAPADPSSQDLRVAADATHMEQEAQAEERQAALEKQKSTSTSTTSNTQKQSNPVIDAMIRKAYATAQSKTTSSSAKPVLGIFSA